MEWNSLFPPKKGGERDQNGEIFHVARASSDAIGLVGPRRLRKGNKLLRCFSPQGLCKVWEMFRLFDLDEDGELSFQEFSDYAFAFPNSAVVSTTILQSDETFRCWIHDLTIGYVVQAGLDLPNVEASIQEEVLEFHTSILSKYGNMTFVAFIWHRMELESGIAPGFFQNYADAYEVVTNQVPESRHNLCVSRLLDDIRTLREREKTFVAQSVSFEAARKLKIAWDQFQTDVSPYGSGVKNFFALDCFVNPPTHYSRQRSKVSLAVMHTLVFLCGEVAIEYQMKEILQLMRTHSQTMGMIRRKEGRKRFVVLEQESLVDDKDDKHIYFDTFYGWFFSRRLGCAGWPLHCGSPLQQGVDTEVSRHIQEIQCMERLSQTIRLQDKRCVLQHQPSTKVTIDTIAQDTTVGDLGTEKDDVVDPLYASSSHIDVGRGGLKQKDLSEKDTAKNRGSSQNYHAQYFRRLLTSTWLSWTYGMFQCLSICKQWYERLARAACEGKGPLCQLMEACLPTSGNPDLMMELTELSQVEFAIHVGDMDEEVGKIAGIFTSERMFCISMSPNHDLF